jgi:hypothetical protein
MTRKRRVAVMIRQLLFSRACSNDIVQSGLFCESTFYTAFVRDIKKAEREVLIERPHI